MNDNDTSNYLGQKSMTLNNLRTYSAYLLAFTYQYLA